MFINKPYRLAIIDDNDSIREVISMTIDDHFKDVYQTVSYPTVKEAMDGLLKESVEILLLDVHMPDKYGDSFLYEYKKEYPNKIVIMMSGDTSFTVLSNTYLDGASYYLKKPFSTDEFIAILNHCKFTLDHWSQLFHR